MNENKNNRAKDKNKNRGHLPKLNTGMIGHIRLISARVQIQEAQGNRS